jgi:hypothetical protein
MTDLDTDTTAAELHALLGRAVADLDVPTTRLHDASVRRGRAARRRRRTGIVLGGLAAGAAVAALAVPLLAAGTSTGGQVAHEGRALPPPDVDEPAPGWWDMPGLEMDHRLGFLLPDRLSISMTMSAVDDGWLQVDVTDDDGDAGGVNVVLYPPADDGGAFVTDLTTCPGNLSAPDSCTEVRNAAGDVVGRESRTATSGVVVVEATHLTPDGGVVYAAASNSSDAKWGRGSSTDTDHPPMTLAELRAVVEARSWQQDWGS